MNEKKTGMRATVLWDYTMGVYNKLYPDMFLCDEVAYLRTTTCFMGQFRSDWNNICWDDIGMVSVYYMYYIVIHIYIHLNIHYYICICISQISIWHIIIHVDRYIYILYVWHSLSLSIANWTSMFFQCPQVVLVQAMEPAAKHQRWGCDRWFSMGI